MMQRNALVFVSSVVLMSTRLTLKVLIIIRTASITRRGFSREEWQEFLRFTRQRLGNVWQKDNGILRDIREAVKYICKLGDGQPDKEGAESWGADELSSSELACLHRETYRQKHFQPVGSLLIGSAIMMTRRL